MLKQTLVSVCIALMAGAAQSAKAGVFDTADNLFAQREGNAANIAAARAAYQNLLGSVTGDDLAYAVQQIGRLAVYEADYFLSADAANDARRAAVYDDCRNVSKKLDGLAGQVSVYAYWRMSCTAQWMKYADVQSRLQQLADTRAYFDKVVTPALELDPSLHLDTRYQGGGMERVMSGIFANQLASLMRSTLPNGAKAVDMATRAIAEQAYPTDPSQNAGSDYFRNYRHKAEAQKFLGQTADAKATLTDAIGQIQERIDSQNLPAGMEPETKGELVLMQAERAALSNP